MSNIKYNCVICNFKTNYVSVWEKHINTEKHRKTGVKRKVRRDKKIGNAIRCQYCEYTHQNKTSLRSHILNNHANKDDRKKGFKYYCEVCNVGTFSNLRYKEHLQSRNHVMLVNADE